MAKFKKSEKLLQKAKRVIPGGINSPARVREPKAYPMFIDHAKGSHFWDVDGNEFIDYVLGFGPLILGHAHPKVNEAVKEQLERGTLLTTLCNEVEQKVAEMIVEGVPCAEMVRFQNTGSSACTATLRMARAYSGKEKICRFEMGMHGWHDWARVKVAGGLENNYLKSFFTITGEACPGIPMSVLQDILILPWNNIEVTEKIIKRREHEIAAVICEPLRPPLLPQEGFLEALREITEKHDILLIFDEVKSGFRAAFGGAQEYLKVVPDLAPFAKALGNGFPVAAIAGKREIMELITPITEIAGTYTANSVSMAAAFATLKELKAGNGQAYKRMHEVGCAIKNGMKDAIEDTGVEAIVVGPETMFTIIFTELEEITNFKEWQEIIKDRYKRAVNAFGKRLIDEGIYLRPGVGVLIFISSVHTKEDANKTIQATYEALKEAKKFL